MQTDLCVDSIGVIDSVDGIKITKVSEKGQKRGFGKMVSDSPGNTPIDNKENAAFDNSVKKHGSRAQRGEDLVDGADDDVVKIKGNVPLGDRGTAAEDPELIEIDDDDSDDNENEITQQNSNRYGNDVSLNYNVGDVDAYPMNAADQPSDDVDVDDDDEDDEDIEGEANENDDDDDVIMVDDMSRAAPPASVLPAANEYNDLAKRLMKPLPDYPIKEQTYNVWEITDWNGFTEDKVRGPLFRCGGFEWNILLFPRGNNNNNLSIYIEPHPIERESQQNGQPDNWYVCAKFGLDLWNPSDPKSHYASGSFHRFNQNETDWGFSSLIELRQLKSVLRGHNRPILENNRLNITAYVQVIDDSSTGMLWHSFADYDSKLQTGFVGLSNQGATCYLNSLLQSYYTTKNFRKLVYQIPMDDASRNSVAYALQKIFYLLLTSNDTVGTLELTKSFGWDSTDAFTQHDVQELNRILMDRLETAMKGTPIENRLNDIFVGKMKSYIKCVNVPYESAREEDFWDIQLNVKGFKKLEDSFKNYIEIEMLEGENKYQAGDEYGYQDAKKGVVFESFPPVLHLQLKRFEYDFIVDDLVKIDDLYEFPDSINLKPYLDEDLPESVKQENWNYKLHGVLVHQGSISNGHYYAMIKPRPHDDAWFRFDDDKVWKVTPYQVFQENYGADELSTSEFARLSRVDQNENLIRRATSAYMLVYYRESELDNILPDDASVNDSIPEYIPKQIESEAENLERIERLKKEALYYINVKFVTSQNFNAYNGFDLYPDPTIQKYYDASLIDESTVPKVFKVKKEDPLTTLYTIIGQELGYVKEEQPLTKSDIPDLPFRLLMVNHRNNHTNRTDIPVPVESLSSTVIATYMKFFNRKYDEMVFYVEEVNKELKNVNLLSISESCLPNTFSFDKVFTKINDVAHKDSGLKFHDINEQGPYILIALKYFDVVSGEIKGLTHVTVSKDAQILSIESDIQKFLGLSSDVKLNFYEELSPFKIEPIDTGLTFEKHELSNGDILCVEPKNVSDYMTDASVFSSAKEYYKFLFTRLHIVVEPFISNGSNEDAQYLAGDDSDNADKDLSQKLNGAEQGNEELANKSFDTWISTQYTYDELANHIAKKLGNVDPKYLRLFVVNYQGVRYPLKSTIALSQFFPKLVPVSQITTFEYEILNITLKEYENMKNIKIFWVNTILQYQEFDFLIPKNGKVSDLMERLLSKVTVSESQLGNILVWAGHDHKYTELIKFDRSIDTISNGIELYAAILPTEVEILVSYDMTKRFNNAEFNVNDIEDNETKHEIELARLYAKNLNMIPVFQFYKNSNYHHGIPFVFPVYPDEKFADTKKRLHKRLGLGSLAFEKVKFALADSSDKGRYIDAENDDLVLYDEIGKYKTSVSLALDLPDKSPKRVSQFDKGILIK